MATATLDTNVLDATGAELTVTTETLFTLYAIAKTGAHDNHRIVMEHSPDNGTTWLEAKHSLLAGGDYTVSVVATKVRARVCEAEGAVSTITVWILGK